MKEFNLMIKIWIRLQIMKMDDYLMIQIIIMRFQLLTGKIIIIKIKKIIYYKKIKQLKITIFKDSRQNN